MKAGASLLRCWLSLNSTIGFKMSALGLALSLALHCQAAIAQAWAPLIWLKGSTKDYSYEKSALLVPAILNGFTQPLLFQLDTGSPVSIAYDVTFKGLAARGIDVGPRKVIAVKPVYEAETGEAVLLTGQLGARKISEFPFRVRRGFGTSSANLAGSVGLDLFQGKILVLDFPRTRHAVFESRADVSAALARNVAFAKAYIMQNPLRLAVEIEGVSSGLQGQFILDTGASERHVVVFSEGQWKRMTGGTIDSSSVWKDIGSSWGKETKCVSRNSLEPLIVAGKKVGQVPVEYCVAAGEPFASEPGFAGLIGNALFYSKSSLILDLAESGIAVLDN